jgi:amidase
MTDALAAADLLFRPVDELAGLVRDGELSARELVQASLDRIEEVNPRVNAFVDVFAEEALAAADAVGPGDERPLAGVPVAIKNNRAVAGQRLTVGSGFFGDFRPQHDHNVTRRLREAGAIVVGSTTLPEFGILPVTETARFGPTRNPWDLERTPGGSSGGSAAAVASGMVPFAHGNDGGGSTRIPAACCGLVGLKPQRGRISLAPEVGEHFLVQDGVLTRTVRETALCLDVLAGAELGDSSWAPPPAEPFATTAAAEPRPLRVALTMTPPIPDAAPGAAQVAAVREAGEALAALGHEVEEVEAPWQNEGLAHVFTAVFGPAVCSQAAFGAIISGREPAAEDMESLSWWLWQTCKGIDAVGAEVSRVQIQAAGRMVVTWTSQWDVVITPALSEAPVTIGTIDPTADDPDVRFRRSATFTPYTALLNVSGQPAISVPLAEADGLPVGVQLIGRPAEEGALLAVAAQLETARPWADRRAPVA